MGIKGIVTRLCEIPCMCQVPGWHKDRSNQLLPGGPGGFTKGTCSEGSRQIMKGLRYQAEDEDGTFRGSGKTTCACFLWTHKATWK